MNPADLDATADPPIWIPICTNCSMTKIKTMPVNTYSAISMAYEVLIGEDVEGYDDGGY